MSAEKPIVPDGVTVVVLLDNHAMGTASDFERSGYGGMSLRESQEHRAKLAAWHNVFQATCHPHLAAAIRAAVRTQAVAQRLRVTNGWREHVIVHGHEEDE